MRIPELYTQKPVLQIKVDILTVFKNQLFGFTPARFLNDNAKLQSTCRKLTSICSMISFFASRFI